MPKAFLAANGRFAEDPTPAITAISAVILPLPSDVFVSYGRPEFRVTIYNKSILRRLVKVSDHSLQRLLLANLLRLRMDADISFGKTALTALVEQAQAKTKAAVDLSFGKLKLLHLRLRFGK